MAHEEQWRGLGSSMWGKEDTEGLEFTKGLSMPGGFSACGRTPIEDMYGS